MPKTKRKGIFEKINEKITSNKIVMGIVMLLINVVSKYATIELSDTQQEYFNNTIIRHIFLFLILFSSTKDLFLSIILLVSFIIMAQYLFNEKSRFCILKFPQKDCKKKPISKKQINEAIKTLKQAKQEFSENIDKELN